MSDESILVFAPAGSDAELAASALDQAGLHPEICTSSGELVGKLTGNCGAILVSEEALCPPAGPQLFEALNHQHLWSDLPMVVLTGNAKASEELRSGHNAQELFGANSNVTLLERPVRAQTLTRTMHVALRNRRRQYEIRRLFEQHEQALASIGDAFALIDCGWKFDYANQEMRNLLGCPEPVGRIIWEVIPSAAGTRLERELRAAMEKRINIEFETSTADWSGRWFSFRIHPSKEGISLLAVEITERKRIESNLQETERRLHLALDSSHLGMWFCDLPHRKIHCDLNCKNQLGLPAESDIDFEDFLSYLHPGDRERTRQAVQRAIDEQGPYDIEYRVLHADGRIVWLNAIGRAFYNQAGAPYRFDGITIDISARKESELQLKQAREEAVEASRAKDQFLAALSHELRTPLTPVLMAVASLRQESGISPRVREDLDMIHRNVELEARLIDDLLDLTRIAHGKLILDRELFDVHEVLARSVDICCHPEVLPKALEVEFLPQATQHHVDGDSARLQQVFWNLLSNAVKFTPPGGRILLSTSNPHPGQLEIAVADTGIGIDAEGLPRLFDAFEQANVSITRRFGGLGLGLAICKALAELHHGSIRAESAGRGQGARFTLTLNTCEAPGSGPQSATAQEITSVVPLRILLAEDHEPTREVLCRLLSRAGHRVSAAGSVAEALTVAGSLPFDLLVSDVGLPDASGMELMRIVHSRYGMPGVALSGYGMEEDILASKEAGFSAHLTKPVDWKRLESTLAQFNPLPLSFLHAPAHQIAG